LLRWRKQVYDPKTGKIGLAKDYKKQLQVIMNGPNGEYERVAKLKGCWPTADPPADLNMESPEKLLMEIPISVDKIDWSDSITGA